MSEEFEIDDLVAGWMAARNRAAVAVWNEHLLSSGRVLHLSIAVEASPEDDLSPLLLWIPRTANIHQQERGARPRIATPVTEIAALNARRRSLHKTLGLLAEVSGRSGLFRLACMLAALHGLRASGVAVPPWTPEAVEAICGRLGKPDVHSIWHYAGQDTLPMLGWLRPRPEASPHEFGSDCGRYMSRVYRHCFPARVWPICDPRFAGPTIAELRACLARVSSSPSQPYGNAEWRRLGKETLEVLVWTVPRTRLCRRFDVSDKAIAKRCNLWGISQPPRGFWQQVSRAKHPGEILRESGVRPPPGIDIDEIVDRIGRYDPWDGPVARPDTTDEKARG